MILELGLRDLIVLRRPFAGPLLGKTLSCWVGCELEESTLASGYPSLVGQRTWRLLVGGGGGGVGG
jgi:hypothetical protein